MARASQGSVKKEEEYDDGEEDMRYEEDEEEPLKQGDHKWLRDLKSAEENVKKKKGNRGILSEDSIRARLAPVGLEPFPIPLDRVTQGALVSRAYLTKVYGGSSQAMFPKISAENVEKHGKAHWGYMHLDYQPMAPQLPGAPGLVYSTAPGDLDRHMPAKGHYIFTRMSANEWQFMGRYRLDTCEPLSKEEWLSLGPTVHKTWGREMARAKWGNNARCRILGRRDLGREPTLKEQRAIKSSGRYKSITEGMIIAAYSRGEERIGVWTLKCIDYDADFQKKLSQLYPPWKEAQKRKKTALTKVKNPGKKTKGAKRKRGANDDEDDQVSSTASESEYKSEPSDGEPRRKRTKDKVLRYGGGTRSRPRKVPSQVIDVSD